MYILIYIFAGLLTIVGAVLLAVCINQYRKKGNQSTKRYVGTICLKIPLFLHFKRCNIYPTYRYICVHLSRVVSFDVLGL